MTTLPLPSPASPRADSFLRQLWLALLIVALLTAGLATVALAADMAVDHHGRGTMMAYTAGGLAEGFDEAVAELDATETVAVLRGGRIELAASRDAEGATVDEPGDGAVIPLEAVAVDPDRLAAAYPTADVAAMRQLDGDAALLTETSAHLRRLDAGGTLELVDGTELTVAGVVDDDVGLEAEVLVADPALLPDTANRARAVVFSYRGPRDDVEAAIAELAPGALRVVAPGETVAFRFPATVLPQAQVKNHFGEFSYRRGQGRSLQLEEAWVDRALEQRDVPILGRIRCHKAVIDDIEAALTELAEADLGHLIDAGEYGGCYGPRLISTTGGVSRHAWGIAIDFNVSTNQFGEVGTLDERVVEAFTSRGFMWAGSWLTPDPMHFEWVGE